MYLLLQNILDLEDTLTKGGITILTVEAITDKDQHQAQIKNLQVSPFDELI